MNTAKINAYFPGQIQNMEKCSASLFDSKYWYTISGEKYLSRMEKQVELFWKEICFRLLRSERQDVKALLWNCNYVAILTLQDSQKPESLNMTFWGQKKQNLMFFALIINLDVSLLH